MADTTLFMGMHGLGDTFHERPLLQAAARRGPVEVITSWPSVLFDIPVRCVRAKSHIPYCAQNEVNEAHMFVSSSQSARRVPLTYLGHELAAGDTFSSSMAKRASVQPEYKRYVPPDEWGASIDLAVTKPIMFYRPLLDRKIWGAMTKRNPLREVYDAVFAAIRQHFFVVSVADLTFGIEHIISNADADLELHQGELSYRQMAWLVSRSALVFSSPGMGVVMGLHCETPTIGIFGGYENARVYGDATPGPFCAIEPITPCCCFDLAHKCDKIVDLPRAIERAKEFVDATLSRTIAAAA